MGAARSVPAAEMRVNGEISPRVQEVGDERTPVILIDDFARDPAAIIEHACVRAKFAPVENSGYPGMRAALSRSQVAVALDALEPLLRSVYSIPDRLLLKPRELALSLVTTREPRLRQKQSGPHTDSNDAHFFAITHYLNRGDFGGTGFYRHRPTGYETITSERVTAYFAACYTFFSLHGVPRPRYFREGDGHYELIHRVGYAANRLVAYPGCLLHSGLIDPARDVDADPRTGRLTANLFLEFREP